MSEAGRLPETAQVEVLQHADALRAHLDALNEAGEDYRAVGMDARGEPFLICLDGPYVETEVVFFGSPWDGEVEYDTPVRCEECMASGVFSIEALRFPVTVLVNPVVPSNPPAPGGGETEWGHRYPDGSIVPDSSEIVAKSRAVISRGPGGRPLTLMRRTVTDWQEADHG